MELPDERPKRREGAEGRVDGAEVRDVVSEVLRTGGVCVSVRCQAREAVQQQQEEERGSRKTKKDEERRERRRNEGRREEHHSSRAFMGEG